MLPVPDAGEPVAVPFPGKAHLVERRTGEDIYQASAVPVALLDLLLPEIINGFFCDLDRDPRLVQERDLSFVKLPLDFRKPRSLRYNMVFSFFTPEDLQINFRPRLIGYFA